MGSGPTRARLGRLTTEGNARIRYEDRSIRPQVLLDPLGPEPLDTSSEYGGDYLYQKSRGRTRQVRDFIMDSHVVVGVGNIYASEALFLAGIHPGRSAGRISLERYERLVESVREVLEDAITAGGTTLRDFVDTDGNPGYFARELRVYGREGEQCGNCGTPILGRVIGQRSTFYCPRCQR